MFFSQNGNAEEGFYYALTPWGTAALVLLTVAFLVLIAFLKRPRDEETAREQRFSAKQLVFSGMCIAIAFALSYVRVIRMPWGGAVTLCSMLFVTLIGYWYGPKIGLAGAFAYSLLQFIQDGGSYVLSPLQACLDYIFAFTALGASGFFHGKKDGLRRGYLFAVLLRGLFHTLGGYLYWMDYMPDNFPKSLSFIYPFCYNYAFLLAEAAVTLLLLSLPPVRAALQRAGAQARS
ncbi:MAG: energy-coupled thiamine transporter ThiT [Lachnospiraceae bacterium]|nr:energy-coupled thiamine transporter ThiT [Lachnospiraceae bacterium]